LGSQVRREFISVYDLDPVAIGRFDVVVCGDLLLHLRDPARALAAVRRVCRGVFLSAEQIDLRLTMLQPLRPALYVSGQLGQWFIPNHAGHARLLDVAGFDVLQQTRYAIPRGPSHPVAPPSWRERFRRLGERWVAGGEGLPTSAILCRPAA
jgi:tRNA (mo5U34)-methyltransferase